MPGPVEPTRRPALAEQPGQVPFPTDSWPSGKLPAGTDEERLEKLVEQAMGPTEASGTGLTLSFVAVVGGAVVREAYGETSGPAVNLISWSMAKSFAHALTGILIGDGALQLEAPAAVPAWQGAGDPRKTITLADLLAMRSGLAFIEDYDPETGATSDVIEMLFGAGQQNVGVFASEFPLLAEPGTSFSYSSGTSNIISEILGRTVGNGEQGMREFMEERLFAPIGMAADPRFDESGTWVGSSYVYASALDFARFGLLYARDGVWNGRRILPEGWVEHARTPTGGRETDSFWYGNHWWLWEDEFAAFGAHGYEGQYVIVVPDRDLVLVRLGKTVEEDQDNLRRWLKDVIRCFPVGHDSH